MSEFIRSWELDAGESRAEYIQGLRDLANLLESSPDLPLPNYSEEHSHSIVSQKSLYNQDTKEWETEYEPIEMKFAYKAAAKALVKYAGASNVTKEVPDPERSWMNTFAVEVHLSGPHRYRVSLSQKNVCKKVKVGTEVLPAEPERVIPAKPERVADKYEYECADDLVSVLK